ncbi:TKL protein kinase [Salpingoeca rosetta]|uniref:TKL protein kinase n=1 Tax=Salpingoeca rosetta (strain ATCC 50818 / BSB-021) TaxID=946362 RepID=F2U2R6_SALR5|nr:TKL protein kinase [Salpingoeca rosetta]EGD81910.1 TKL protein kinase [Salpingoeca rosetta]|eukprot:XP_004996093.1 TKL protein kinase [Salpingoeca rosetta]
MTTAVVMVLVVAVVTVTMHACSATAATPTTPLRFQQDKQLCSEVHGTLESMVRVLRTHGVAFSPNPHGRSSNNNSSNSNNNNSNSSNSSNSSSSKDDSSHNATTHEVQGAAATANTLHSSLVVDLSPVHRMMTAFGCGNRNDEQPQRSDDESARHDPSHTASRVPLFSAPTHVDDRVDTIRNAKLAQPSQKQQQQQQQRHQRRVRRSDDGAVMHAGACTLASVINGTCPGADDRGGLTIALREEDRVNDTTDASTLRAISGSVIELTVNGYVAELPLRWIVDNGDWTVCSKVVVFHVQNPTFQLSMLNPMTGIATIWVRDSDALREVDTRGFQHEKRIARFLVSNCSLTAVPNVSAMTSLSAFNVHQNRIQRICKGSFTGLTLLHHLALNDNVISKIERGVFDDLQQLRRLDLHSNGITAFPPALFHGLTNLTLLQLQRNPITKLDADVFAALTTLDRLSLEHTLLTSLPPTLFRQTTRLTRLELANNFITSLPETLFSGLSVLQYLQMADNRLTSLPSGVFTDLASLAFLSLPENDLTSLPVDLFRANLRLDTFYCNNNRLTALPSNLLANVSALWFVSFANNALRSIDNVLAEASPSFWHTLDLDNNRLTKLQLARELPSLRRLGLSDNRLQKLPDVSLTPALDTLRLQNHQIKHMDLAPLLQLPNLQILLLDASPQTESRAVLSDTNMTSIAPLLTLRLANVDITAVATVFEHLPPLNLGVLHVGWLGASSATLPITQVCRLLASSVRELRIANTEYRAIELCPDKTVNTLLLTDNKQLRAVTVHNPLRELNVSGCTQLTSIDAPPVDILDISSTNFPLTRTLCTRWGRRILFARNLVKPVDIRQAAATARTCLERVDVLDLSANEWLRHVKEINRAVGRSSVLSDESFFTPDVRPIPSRLMPPILQLTGAPIDCALQFSNQNLRPLRDPNLPTPQIVFSFHCTCARGFKMTSSGQCVVDKPDIAAVAAGSVIGGLALGLLMAWLSRRYRGMTKRIGLQEQLLVERDEEVMALKAAWEIEYDELRMIKRVAAGAFGVVFKAEWDTVTVAVKVLQQAVMAFDESTVLEFEKEVEFLQRTRHPNVVRFFGAGTDPNGSPFLVLEFVAMGSLKDLLGKEMEKVLVEVRNTKVEESSSGGVGDDVSSVWDLKLRLLRDVASGMAFIHSLDQMHRDLKSGNVLVSSSLRAKITDFGSIRQCFTRDRNQQQQRTSLSSSNGDDPQYSQQAGLQTMTSMTLTAGVGTPLYMAPEALTGDKYSFEADIFSFGVLMWEVVTQRVPDLIEQEKGSEYRGPILATISNLLEDGKRLRFEDSEQDAIPEWFQSLTYKCMAQNPRERPSFGELKDHHLV